MRISRQRKIRLSKPGTWLIGKVFSYNLNAIIDSDIARAIVQVNHNKKLDNYSKEVLFRIKEFKKLSENYKNQKAFFYGVAFSQFNCNGYADAWYSQLFEKIFWFWFNDDVKNILTRYYKKASGPSQLNIFDCELIPNKKTRYALKVMNKNSLPLSRILITETGLPYSPLKLKNMKNDFIEGIEMTQNINSKFNHEIADRVFKNIKKQMKEEFILDASEEFKHRQSFINGAINSQLGASNWDFLFKFLLKLFK